MKRLILVAMLVAGCGGITDPIEGNWSLHLNSPVLDGQPATDALQTIDITMTLKVDAAGQISGHATMGAETAIASGQSYGIPSKHGCTIILPFQSMTIEPFCESVTDIGLSGTAFLWGTHTPQYRFAAHH